MAQRKLKNELNEELSQIENYLRKESFIEAISLQRKMAIL